MQTTTEQWFRIKRGACVHVGRPMLAIHISDTEIGGLVHVGGLQGFAPCERFFRPDELTPMDGPPKGRPYRIKGASKKLT